MHLSLSPAHQVASAKETLPAPKITERLRLKWAMGWPFFDRPILVSGAPRTGTSWTAKAIGLARHVRYVREPISHGFEESKRDVNFRYLAADEEQPDYEALWRTAIMVVWSSSKRWMLGEAQPWLRRLPFWPARLLVKEVICPLALEWLEQRFDMQIVLTLRHPCGYVASGLRLRDTGDPFDPMDYLLAQPRLTADYFVDDYDWLCELRDPVSRLTAGYGMIYKVVADQLTRHSDWIVVQHEAFCENPQAHFQQLFEALGIGFSRRIARHLDANSKASDGHLYSVTRCTAEEPDKWKRELSSQQIETVASVISRFRLPFYTEFA